MAWANFGWSDELFGLAQSILQIGALVVIAFIVGMIVIAGFVGAVFRLWSKFFGPPKLPNPAKPPPDALTSVVVVIGWFGWLSAAGLVTQYSLGWGWCSWPPR